MRDPIREFGISDRASVAHCQRRHTARQVAGGAGVDLPKAAAGRPARGLGRTRPPAAVAVAEVQV